MWEGGVEELCGTCGKVKGKDCEGHMVQGVPENGGEKASGKMEGKECEGHMAEANKESGVEARRQVGSKEARRQTTEGCWTGKRRSYKGLHWRRVRRKGARGRKRW